MKSIPKTLIAKHFIYTRIFSPSSQKKNNCTTLMAAIPYPAKINLQLWSNFTFLPKITNLPESQPT